MEEVFVKKRNGKVVPFDFDKVTRAIKCAYFDMNEEDAWNKLSEENLGQLRQLFDDKFNEVAPERRSKV